MSLLLTTTPLHVEFDCGYVTNVPLNLLDASALAKADTEHDANCKECK